MSEFITLEDANKKIQERWGKGIGGKPMYRIAMADQIEMLVDHMGTHHVNRKYECEDPRCYVLEFLADASQNPEIPRDWSYEPLWVFRGPDGEPLPLLWKAIEFILYTLENGTKTTIEDYRKLEEQRKKDSVDAIMGEFERAATESSNPDLVTGETISMGGIEIKKEE